MHRSTIARILRDVDLQPHHSVYWLNRHDPDFDAKAKAVCSLYVQAPTLHQHGELVICSDEKTGMQILERKEPTQLARPGHPEKRERDYIRHGTRAFLASFVVATGEVIGDPGPTRTSLDFAHHLMHVAGHCLPYRRITRVVDNLNTHWSLAVGKVLAFLNHRRCRAKHLRTGAQRRAFLTDATQPYRLVFTPTHGSWLNQIELWFSVLARRFLKRGSFASAAEFTRRLDEFVANYNTHQAHPYRWTYTGEPLVRGTPFAQTRRQAQAGRAWFGQRPQRFERFLYTPRPHQRKAARLAMDLRNKHLALKQATFSTSTAFFSHFGGSVLSTSPTSMSRGDPGFTLVLSLIPLAALGFRRPWRIGASRRRLPLHSSTTQAR
jgi:transposase